MTDTEIETRLKPVFAVVLDVPESAVDESLTVESCAKWDSMQHIHLVHAIEEEFGIVLEFEQQMQMLSFPMAKTIVREALA